MIVALTDAGRLLDETGGAVCHHRILTAKEPLMMTNDNDCEEGQTDH